MENHDRILGYFLEEASEHLHTIEQGLLKLPETVRQPTTIRELFRAAHSIKGSAAMLGLLDIQKIGNQFEANFKLLKEQPQIAVDSHLQSLFLESFGFLKAGIEEVRVSSDPYRQDPATIDPIGDPVFEELKAYLQQLLAVEPAAVVTDRIATDGQKDPAIDQVFGEYVTRKLDAIISLCLQPDLPEVRTQIQQICQKLGNLGENFEFLEWTHLFTACRLATANPANFLPQLGESISIAVKQAQALVLADRDREIRVTADLEALIIGKTAPLQAVDLQSTAALTPNSTATTSNLSTWNLDRETTTAQLPELISIGGSTLPLSPAAQLLDFETTNNLFSTGAFPAELDADALELNEFMNLLGDEPSEGTWMQDDEFLDLALPSIDLDDLANEQFLSPSDRTLANAMAATTTAQLTTSDRAGETSDNNRLLSVPEIYDEETFYTPDLGDLDGPIPDFSSATALSIGQHQQIYADLNSIDNIDGQLQPDRSPSLQLADNLAPEFGLDYPVSDLFPTATTTEDWANLADLPIDQIAEAETINDVDLIDDESFQVATTGMVAAIEHGELASELPTPATIDLQPQDPETEITDGSTATSDILSLEELNSPTSAASADLFGLQDLKNHKFPDASDLSGLANLTGTQPEAITDLNFLDDLDSLAATTDVDLLFLEDLNESELPVAPDLLFLEDLDDSSLTAVDIHLGADLTEPEVTGSIDPDAMAAELNNWFDNATNPDDGNGFGELDLALLDEIESAVSDSDDDRAMNLDLQAIDPDTASDLDLTNDAPVASPALNDAKDRDDANPDLFGQSDLNFLADNSPASDDPANPIDFGDFDFGANSEITGLELDIQNFDDLELNSEIGNGLADVDLDVLASSPLADDAIDAPSAPTEWHDLADLDLQFPANQSDLDLDLDTPTASLLDVNSETSDRDRVNALDPIEPATERDFDSIDMGAFDLDNLAPDTSSTAEFDDLAALDIQLDDLGTDLGSNDLSLDNFDNLSSELNSNDLSLDNFDDLLGDMPADNLPDLGNFDDLLGDMPADNLPDLGNLDALLGVAAVGVGASLLMGVSQSSALDDLDALVAPATTPDSNLDDLDGLFATPAPIVAPLAIKPEREPKDRRPKQSRTFEQTMRVSVRHLNNLNNLVGELVVNRNTLEQDQNRMRQFVEKLLSEVQKLNEVGKRMQDLYERSLMENSLVASRQQNKAAAAAPQTNSDEGSSGNSGNNSSIEYDPLEMDRFTPIHLLSQKMIELTVRVRESTADIEFVVDGSTEVTRTLRQITGQLQEDLTKSRMVPFAQTADRLQRGVRENGLKYGKQVELSVEGRDTPIDKVILESLTDPLIHMVNNAIAHGIESLETRQAAGKSSEGKITIRALHQGNQTIISVSDDGAGIDVDRVKQKAIEKGIITAAQAAAMPKTEVYELLFLPSFSTKDQADELAGRGVGMDVVRTSITEIRGTIATESKLGVGTTFTIRLPLALSIAKALIAVNNKSNIAFPMDGIEDTQDVSPEQIQTDSEGKQCIFWRDELLPFTPLSDLLSFNRPLARNSFYSTNEDDSDLVSILILRSDGNLTAVQVDKITGDQEIVIKPLQGPAAKPLGIAGATVMGDGRIVPIADVMELIELANGTLSRQVSTQWTDQIATPTVEIRESMVLIVDDSITVRELLSLTFKRAGYRVEQARDGQEAWDKLRAGLPCDIVFCDIEMPRMDGLEFLSRIQKDAALSKVPVAMLTSRGSDRHRQIASQLGASGYFIKPYLEEALLDAAKRMIKGEVLEIV